jgi:hypothetical protein
MGCGCLLGPVVSFFKWCFTTGLKGFIILAVVIVILVVGFVVVKNKISKIGTPAVTTTTTLTTPAVNLGVPTTKDAPYIVSTTSRYYYCATAITDKKTQITTLTDYWTFNGAAWVKQTGILILGPEYGVVKIKKR